MTLLVVSHGVLLSTLAGNSWNPIVGFSVLTLSQMGPLFWLIKPECLVILNEDKRQFIVVRTQQPQVPRVLDGSSVA